MNAETHSQLANFIWSICNLLRGPVQAERISQGHPAADGAAPIRLPAGAHEGEGPGRARQDQEQARDCRSQSAPKDHGAPVLQPVEARLRQAARRSESACAQSERVHQQVFDERPRHRRAVRIRRTDRANGREEPALRSHQSLRARSISRPTASTTCRWAMSSKS